jgi:uncharacterized protein (DUF2236 family)
MWIGGISALHLQALHPVTALGIARNSSFERDPGRRLRETRRAGFRLRAQDGDRYVFEQRRTAELVGLPAADAPGSVAELEEYLTAMRGVLAVSAEARSIQRFLFKPPLQGSHRALAPAWRSGSRLAYSIMPAWAHELYARPGGPAALSTGVLRASRRVALAVPWRVRLAYPEPVLEQAVARLGRDGIPLRGFPVTPPGRW